MSDVRFSVNSFFERGLDDITFSNTSDHTGLPPLSELPPPEVRSQQLNQLLNLPDIATFLEEAIHPDIEDREQLTPGRFRHTLATTLISLTQEAETMSASDPAGTKVINRALRVLRDEASLRELIQMYRTAVHQG